MNRYIAKTYPEEETIQEHTDKLIENYNILKSIYPNLKVNWELLKLACLYHDLGKMNLKFQRKCKGKKVENEVPHGILSTSFLDINDLKQKYTKEEIKVLVNAIAYHHERDFNLLEYEDLVTEEIEKMREEAKNFKYKKIPNCKVFKLPSGRYLKSNGIAEEDGEEVIYDYILVKGLLNRIDYASSAHEKVEWKNNFLEKALENMMNEWKRADKNASWNNLQKYMKQNRDENVIVIAQTGMGKTEGGLLWMGNNKGFFTLPIRTAINAIYDRIRKNIVKDNLGERVGLLHSDALSEYLKREEDKEDKLDLEELGLNRYYERTKQLTMPLTICTIDQLFDFIYKYRGFESKLATLAYSKIVIDEIQMYSSDLIAYLVAGLSHITKLGGKFAILTATFPKFIEDLLLKEGIRFKKPEPFIDEDENKVRHSIKVIDKMINANFIIEKYNKNKVLVICNTVRKAQELYDEIINEHPELRNEINLFHSSFIKKDRAEKERKILELGKKENYDGYGIWICTQVVEASLDIDFDILITELSDLNGLFQRIGRCYRHRYFNQDGYNCYVFTGGGEKCSGVGKIIDEYIFDLSKESLKNIDGKISEKEKIELIDNLYTTEKLKGSKYYKDVVDTLNYVNSLYIGEMDKNEARKRFRNINSITVIPEKVFKDNREEIEKCKKIISKEKEKSMSDKEWKDFKLEKIKARIKLMDYTVSIPYYLINNKNIETFEISKYESIAIFKCEYDEERGIRPIKELVKTDEVSNWHNFV